MTRDWRFKVWGSFEVLRGYDGAPDAAKVPEIGSGIAPGVFREWKEVIQGLYRSIGEIASGYP